jgi:hypothetical protein
MISLSEADTCRKFVIPNLRVAGWDDLVLVNLDLKNPNVKNDIRHRLPEELVTGIFNKERRIFKIVSRIKTLLEKPS